ncbi:MAG: alkaline phosphatase family protein [Planctomycetes bacterium]|nr:alkaline phosphatase family protein [Planctomycetota bacterium]
MHHPTARRSVRWTRAVALATAAACVAGVALAAPDAPQVGKVIVVGFDGLAADRVESLMAAGKMKNFAKLRDGGGYARLRPSNPAQSPVSWASVTTGWNPGKTGIYDFLRREDMDPRSINIALAARSSTEPLSQGMRVLLVCVAALLGGITGGGIAYAIGASRREWRKGLKFEGSLTFGAAAFACAAFGVLRWVPETVPTAVNLRSGEPFWVTLDKAGIRTVAIEAPLCFPPDQMNTGCCLAGLGVPDMAGTWGSFSVWTDDPMVPAKTETAGRGYYVAPRTNGPSATEFELLVEGPPNPLLDAAAKDRIRAAADAEAARRDVSLEWTKSRRRESETAEQVLRLGASLVARFPVSIHRGRTSPGAAVRLQDGSSVELAPGRWTDLLPVVFHANPVVKLHGRVRLLLDDPGNPLNPADPASRTFRVFVGQVQWDLANVPPNVQLTSPASFAKELAAGGPTETIGWPEMTNPVKDRLLSDKAFIDHTYLLLALRERRFLSQLDKGDFRCIFTLFSEPDRVQHALYRHVDPESPTYDAAAARTFGGEIDRVYLEADRIVGETLRRTGPDDVVLVVSDHGFAPFRRGVNLNNLLRAKGWQTGSGASEQQGVDTLGRGGLYFKDVDWSRTKAYGMGLGNVYLNLAGREPNGSVPVDQADAVIDAIAKDIADLRDTDGKKVARKVYRGKDLYHGARSGEAPDLVVGFEWGYRVSWQSCLGALDADVITPNTQPWSGDHCSVDPELVPAVLFCNRPLPNGAAPSVEDVAPAVLGLFGVKPNDPDGKSFLAK